MRSSFFILTRQNGYLKILKKYLRLHLRKLRFDIINSNVIEGKYYFG